MLYTCNLFQSQRTFCQECINFIQYEIIPRKRPEIKVIINKISTHKQQCTCLTSYQKKNLIQLYKQIGIIPPPLSHSNTTSRYRLSLIFLFIFCIGNIIFLNDYKRYLLTNL